MIFDVAMVGAGVVWALCPVGELERFEADQLHMGTKFTIVLYAPDEPTANRGFAAAFARIQALDNCLSDYNPESELSRLGAASPTAEPLPASADVIAVLARAQQVAAQSDGAFDVTVGPLTKLWRRARRLEQLPSPQRIQEALAAVGYQSLIVDANAHTVCLLKPHMRLDVGGIAKGYAVDQALAELDQSGITRALVNAGGDMAASGPPPGQPGWTVGIAPLSPHAPPSVFGALAHQAVTTSGDAFQFVEIDHVRYSHIVDPHTGLGLTHRSSVSVLARNCTDADALASAISVLGVDAGLRWIAQFPATEALVVCEQDGQIVTRQTTGFAAWVIHRPAGADHESGAPKQ